jgi:hypothetical protein
MEPVDEDARRHRVHGAFANEDVARDVFGEVLSGCRAGWRVTSVPTLIRSPGCYAFQVDGLGFSYALAFGVQDK